MSCHHHHHVTIILYSVMVSIPAKRYPMSRKCPTCCNWINLWLQEILLRGKTTEIGAHNTGSQEETRRPHRVLQDFNWEGEYRSTSVVSSSMCQIIFMVSEVTVSSYPSTDPVSISGKNYSVKGSSVIGTVFLRVSSTQLRSTRSRIN